MIPGQPFFPSAFVHDGSQSLAGLPVYTSEYLATKIIETVPRTWRERLFSRPWMPLMSTKEVSRLIPDENYYLIGGRLVMHPVTLGKLRAAILGDDNA